MMGAEEDLARAPPCAARTVDVSGDGENNQGLGPADIYGGSLLDGATVNALIIDRPPCDRNGLARLSVECRPDVSR